MLKTGIKKRQNSDVEKWKIYNFFVVYVNIFKTTHGPYVNISKHFADHLPTPKCKRNLWRLPNESERKKEPQIPRHRQTVC